MKPIRRHAAAIVLALTGLVVALIVYPDLPAQVPVHWSATGVIDQRMPKDIGAFIQPLTALAIVGLMIAGEPRNWREPQAGAMHSIYPAMVAVVSGFMLYMTVLLLLAGVGAHLDIPTDLTVGIGILLAALGNSFGKVPRNRLIGIRFPWTLSSSEVWSRTHRVAGWLFALGGALAAAFALITRSPLSPLFGAGVMIAASVVTSVYSFVLSRRLARGAPPGE